MNRRDFLRNAGGWALGAGMLGRTGSPEEAPRPNVVVVITDDQGYGDLGCHGNPQIKTPNLDRLHGESVRFTQFHVCPVCSPTRSTLMTGRYNYRTGAIDTYLGRSMMYPEEFTLAELLGGAGYRTGIFGKWHLGDNYPMRAMDQGFEESLVHNGGGIGQPSDPPGNSYFDPLLKHNGETKKYTGYCTDIFTNAAMEFIETHRNEPFFVYLSTNAPHWPPQVEEALVKPYTEAGLSEVAAKAYAMIENIDDNMGKLMEKLESLGLAENTLLIFLTDNGAGPGAKDRFNCGQRGWKGSVYQGGIHVPFFVRWPKAFAGGRDVDRIAAHIDIFPTLAAACGAKAPEGVHLDGRSLLPLLRDAAPDWPDRNLFFQWHRGDVPELYRDCAVRSQRYKLVNGVALYDLEADPAEEQDIAGDHPDIVTPMRAAYEEWFRDVSATRGYDPPRIHVATPHENPVILTRQDWRGAEGWADKDKGYWEVQVTRPATCDVTIRFTELTEAGSLVFRAGGEARTEELPQGADSCVLRGVVLKPGPDRVEAAVHMGPLTRGVQYVEIDARP